MKQHPMEYVQDLQKSALVKMDQGDWPAAKDLIRQALAATELVPLSPGWNDCTPPDLREHDENAIICLQYEDPVVFAANPYFDLRSEALFRELRALGIEVGARIVLDLLCANGPTNRFFEAVCTDHGLGYVTTLPEDQWIERRELHAQPLGSYARDNRLNTSLLTPAQAFMVGKGKAFPIQSSKSTV